MSKAWKVWRSENWDTLLRLMRAEDSTHGSVMSIFERAYKKGGEREADKVLSQMLRSDNV